MEVNPYQSPTSEPASLPEARQELAPAWCRYVSLPLIIFGTGYLLAPLMAAVELATHGLTALSALYLIFFIVGIVFLWLARKLRLKKPRHKAPPEA